MRQWARAALALVLGLLLVALVLAACRCSDVGTSVQAVYTRWHTFHSDAVITATGTTMNVEGLAVVGVQVEGIINATVGCEGSIDGVTYYGLAFVDVTTGLTSTETTADKLFVVPVSGISLLRCPVTVYVSGTIDVRGDGTVLGR